MSLPFIDQICSDCSKPARMAIVAQGFNEGAIAIISHSYDHAKGEMAVTPMAGWCFMRFACEDHRPMVAKL